MATAQAESTIPAGTWQSDPIHSSVGFAVKHVVGTFRGTFNDFEATLSDADGSPNLSGRAKVESVQVKEENLYAHLLSRRSSSSRSRSPGTATGSSSTAS